MKAKGKGHDGKELRQCYGFPRDWNNSDIDGSGRQETSFPYDQDNKVAGAEMEGVQRLNSKLHE